MHICCANRGKWEQMNKCRINRATTRLYQLAVTVSCLILLFHLRHALLEVRVVHDFNEDISSSVSQRIVSQVYHGAGRHAFNGFRWQQMVNQHGLRRAIAEKARREQTRHSERASKGANALLPNQRRKQTLDDVSTSRSVIAHLATDINKTRKMLKQMPLWFSGCYW